MGAKQGLENVVDAARLAEEMNSPVHFILVGAGSEREALQVSGRGCTKLTFVDPLDDQDFRLALGAADVLLVNEKLGVSEMAMPSKLTSYFDAGRPVVAATDLRGITASEIAAADGGVVVDAGDPAKLLDAILALRNDPDAAAQLGLNGRRHRETNLDQGQAIAHWDSLLAEVLMTRRQGHGAPYAAPEPPSVK
jgi:glycosyltransferase involved in cell wall biosynthesis